MILSICLPLPGKNVVTGKTTSKNWEAATWKGSRSVQLRAALAMTLRQRFQALEELTVLSQRLANMPRETKRAIKRNRAAR